MGLYLCVHIFSFLLWNTRISDECTYRANPLSICVSPIFLRNSVAKVALVAATVWVHEMAIFTCVPLYFAIEYICCGRKKVAFAALGVSLFSFCLIWGSFSTVDEETIRIYKQTIYDAGYKMGEDYFDVFRHTLHGSRLRWQTYYNNNLGWWNRGWDAIIFCFLMSATLWHRCPRC